MVLLSILSLCDLLTFVPLMVTARLISPNGGCSEAALSCSSSFPLLSLWISNGLVSTAVRRSLNHWLTPVSTFTENHPLLPRFGLCRDSGLATWYPRLDSRLRDLLSSSAVDNFSLFAHPFTFDDGVGFLV